MPLYEYQCEACGRTFEKIQKFSDTPLEVCELCGKGPVRKLISSPAIQFKGSGWYITDYAKKSGDSASTKAASETKSDKTDTAAKSDSTPAKDTPKAPKPD